MRKSDMILRRLLIAATVFGAVFATRAQPQEPARAPVLEQVKRRGVLACGVTAGVAGFARQNEAGAWSGFDVDFCRALAAAIFDDESKVRVTPLAAKDRAGALQTGWVDLISGGGSWTLARDAGQGHLYAAVSFFDGQGFLTRRKFNFASAQDLAGKAVCAQQGTSHELALADYFQSRKASYEAKLFPAFEEAAKAFEAGQCDALSADLSTLHAARAKFAEPGDYVALPDLIAKALHGPIVRSGDDQWLNIVRWTLFVLLDAEELGVTSAGADQALKSENPDIRRLLGVDGAHGDGLGLSADWAYRIVKRVGGYGEIFERNLGQASPLGMERRLNALWTKGGLMVAPPAR